MPPRALGFVIALVTLGVAQGFEAWMLYGVRIATREPIILTPFFDLRMAWNTGISYSLFRADSPLGREVLVGVSLVASLALSAWLWRMRRRLGAAALGLLLGGALANGLDRAAHGAVGDFLHLHSGGFSPFGVFNIADVAITAGVAILLAEALLLGNTTANKQSSA